MAANDNEKKALARAVDIIKSAERAAQPKWTERQFYLNMYHSYDEVLKRTSEKTALFLLLMIESFTVPSIVVL